MIDVVNEPDHATPPWINAIGGAGQSGHDWVIWAFEKARQYCPDSTLILNDYNVLRWDTNNFISIANKLKDRGLLDAVGAQAHGLEDQSFSELQSNFNQVAALGVPIYISEYDINIADDNQQRQVMQQQFPFFFENPQVEGVTLWGYIYGQTWRDNTGLIRNGQPRPAMNFLCEYFTGQDCNGMPTPDPDPDPDPETDTNTNTDSDTDTNTDTDSDTVPGCGDSSQSNGCGVNGQR
jgi:GH35 family endo-1,4-beta-xylanase